MHEKSIKRDNSRLTQTQIGSRKADLFRESRSSLDIGVGLKEIKVAGRKFGRGWHPKGRIGPRFGERTAYWNDRVKHPSPQAGANLENLPQGFHIRRIDKKTNAGRAEAK